MTLPIFLGIPRSLDRGGLLLSGEAGGVALLSFGIGSTRQRLHELLVKARTRLLVFDVNKKGANFCTIYRGEKFCTEGMTIVYINMYSYKELRFI
jgi:hypothetical protein